MNDEVRFECFQSKKKTIVEDEGETIANSDKNNEFLEVTCRFCCRCMFSN